MMTHTHTERHMYTETDNGMENGCHDSEAKSVDRLHSPSASFKTVFIAGRLGFAEQQLSI